MKNTIIKILHFLIGYESYLVLFSRFKIKTLSADPRKTDFLFFEKLLAENAIIVVIGACTGITTVPFVNGHSGRKVFAYEPLFSNFNALNKILSLYHLTTVHTFNVGLGNKTEYRELILPVIDGVKKHGMAHLKDQTITEYNVGISEIVFIDCLDNRAELQSIKIDALKIVAENFELQILEGARKLIKEQRPVIYCELWHNEKRKEVLEYIESLNYSVFYNKNKQLVSYKQFNYSGKNFFFKSNL